MMTVVNRGKHCVKQKFKYSFRHNLFVKLCNYFFPVNKMIKNRYFMADKKANWISASEKQVQ